MPIDEVMGLMLGVPGAQGGAAFSPTDIDGLAAWHDASDATTLFQDAAGTTPATDDGSRIGCWMDKSGAGCHLTQTNADKRPTLKLNIQNGLAGIRGDGTDDSLSFSGAALAMFQDVAYATVFIVHNTRQTEATARRLLDFSIGIVGAPTTARFGLTDGSTANRVRVFARRLDNDSSAVVAESNTAHNGATCVWTVMARWAAGTLILRQNGQDVASANFASSGNTSNTPSAAAAALSNANNSGQQAVGDTYEQIIYVTSAPLTGEQITQVETYLSQKWGILF